MHIMYFDNIHPPPITLTFPVLSTSSHLGYGVLFQKLLNAVLRVLYVSFTKRDNFTLCPIWILLVLFLAQILS
jgi:hypothetical protein